MGSSLARYVRSESGLILPFQQEAEPLPPPKHPLQQVICDAMGELSEKLSGFEQTTHGRIDMGGGIESVAAAIVSCYSNPTAYQISDLSQAISQFLKKQ